jgi:hypothetical protein
MRIIRAYTVETNAKLDKKTKIEYRRKKKG